MPKQRRPATDAVEIIHRLIYEGKPARLKALEEARANEEVARKIYELRTKGGLTQTQLAKLIGTTASVICRRRRLRRSLPGNAASDRERVKSAGRDQVRFHSEVGVGGPRSRSPRTM